MLVQQCFLLGGQLPLVVVDSLTMQPHTQDAFGQIRGLLMARPVTAGIPKVLHLLQALLPPDLVLDLPLRRQVPTGNHIQPGPDRREEGAHLHFRAPEVKPPAQGCLTR